MKYIKKLIAWFNARNEERARVESANVAREAEERVQLREFKGNIYITIDEIPVVAVSSHIKDAIAALEESRLTYRAYIQSI